MLAGRREIKKNSSTGLEILRYCNVLWIKVRKRQRGLFFQAALQLPVKTM